eukprot:5705474-Prymnesium_polylepis.1
MPTTIQSPGVSGGSGGGLGGSGGDRGGVGGNGGAGGGTGGTGGAGEKQIFQPLLLAVASDIHSSIPSTGTTPTGPLVPQYLTLLIIRESYMQSTAFSTSKAITRAGNVG